MTSHPGCYVVRCLGMGTTGEQAAWKRGAELGGDGGRIFQMQDGQRPHCSSGVFTLIATINGPLRIPQCFVSLLSHNSLALLLCTLSVSASSWLNILVAHSGPCSCLIIWLFSFIFYCNLLACVCFFFFFPTSAPRRGNLTLPAHPYFLLCHFNNNNNNKKALLKYNWYIKNYTSLLWTIWWVWT